MSFKEIINNRFHLRETKYLLNSVLDFQDFWLNLILLCIALTVLFNENLSSFHSYISRYSIGENYVAVYFLISGILNLIRLFYPVRLNVLWVVLLKTFTLSCFILMFFSSIFAKPFLPSSIVYAILMIMSSISLLRAK